MRAPKTRTEIRQDQIAKAALALISRRGFSHLNVAGLARKVGVVPSAVYRHFRGKDEVLDAVLDLVSERLLANVEAVRQETPDSLERLRQLLLRHVQLVRSEVPIPRVVFSEEVFTGHARRRRRVYRMFHEYLAAVAGMIREGQTAGHIRLELDADTLSVMFLGLVQPAAILWLMSDGEFDLARHVNRAWGVFRGTIEQNAASERSHREPVTLRARRGKGQSSRHSNAEWRASRPTP